MSSLFKKKKIRTGIIIPPPHVELVRSELNFKKRFFYKIYCTINIYHMAKRKGDALSSPKNPEINFTMSPYEPYCHLTANLLMNMLNTYLHLNVSSDLRY